MAAAATLCECVYQPHVAMKLLALRGDEDYSAERLQPTPGGVAVTVLKLSLHVVDKPSFASRLQTRGAKIGLQNAAVPLKIAS